MRRDSFDCQTRAARKSPLDGLLKDVCHTITGKRPTPRVGEQSVPVFSGVGEPSGWSSELGPQTDPDYRVVGAGRAPRSLKRFGGPGEIRTHDLFHAI